MKIQKLVIIAFRKLRRTKKNFRWYCTIFDAYEIFLIKN